MSSQPAEVPIPVERPTLEARIATIGAYLLSAGTVFFFVAFLFAFGAMIWLEILLATARRASSPPVAEESSVASFSIFWTTLGVVQVFAFIQLFGVK